MDSVTELDLTQVDGVAVAERTKANITVGSLEDPLTSGISKDIDEVLLVDGRILYQCVARNGGCGKTWETARSVSAHMRAHSGKDALKRTRQELADVQAELDRTKTNRSNAAKKAAATRNAPKTGRPDASVLDEKTAARRVSLMRMVDDGLDLISKGRDLVEEGAAGLAGLAIPLDKEVVEKAAAYDEMRRLLH